MNILMSIVIAFIIIVAGYVGYNASQEVPEAEGHGISTGLNILDTDIIQPYQKQTIIKLIV